uniref:Uncharacterized protein n=1 Tax=Rhizophora mucronata TaxID=61149 RepID=A0A2P2NKM8_RHIMU
MYLLEKKHLDLKKRVPICFKITLYWS